MAEEMRSTAGDDDILLLPPEIWTEILSRVPVKSILRCRSVCKSWYSLISCPNFITKHSTTRNLNENGNRVLLGLFDNKSKLSSFSSHDKLFMESREHDDLPEAFLDRSGYVTDTRIVGSCNGLICLSKRELKVGISGNVAIMTFLIWNPSLRKIVEIPSRDYDLTCKCSYGFGFDSKTGDYKVVFMVGANVCEVFDLGKGVWRGISPLGRPCPFQCPCCVVSHPEFYLHGAVHWNVAGYRNIIDRFLVSFNMSDECFGELKMPDCAEFTDDDDGGSYIGTRSVIFDGMVYVIVWKLGYEDETGVLGNCSIWMMKEYGVQESWTKVSNIDVQSARVLPSTQLWPSGFLLWENGEVLMVHGLRVDDGDEHGLKYDLVSYNTESRKCKRLFSTAKRFLGKCFLRGESSFNVKKGVKKHLCQCIWEGSIFFYRSCFHLFVRGRKLDRR